MKILLVFVLLLANCLIGFTQIEFPRPEFAPIGAEWYYYFNEGMQNPSLGGYYLLKSIKDTVIDSKECKVLSRTRVNSKGKVFNYGQSIVYQDTKENKVFRYLYGNFYLLYDFNKVVGDTIVIKEPYSASSYDSIVTVVDKVGFEHFPNDIYLMSLYVRHIKIGKFGFAGKITEKLGNLHFLFPVNELICDAGCPDPLRCYNDDQISFSLYQLPCDTVYTNTDLVKTAEVSVYPNPFTNSFTIKNSNHGECPLSIDIVNLFGQSILHDVIPENIDYQINLQDYPCGIYYLIIKTEEKSITYKLVKNSYLP